VKHHLPADIEKTSMEIIIKELAGRGITLQPGTERVVRRVIHTTADFDYAENLLFLGDPVARTEQVLQRGGAVLVTDTNMARSGISRPAMKKLFAQSVCFMADEDVARRAKEEGTTRAVVSMQTAAEAYPSAIFAVGNAPTALFALADLLESGLRPTLIVAVPVGFVNVVEAKDRIASVCRDCGVPAIVARGRKGGSTVAAAVCNALLYEAADLSDPAKRGW